MVEVALPVWTAEVEEEEEEEEEEEGEARRTSIAALPCSS